MRLSIGISPCPNDTFIFEAMLHSRIDMQGLDFDYFLSDVEDLNKRAIVGDVDVLKMSCAAYPYVSDNYRILDAGCALGYRNGPLIISKREMSIDELTNARIAIPGKHTTAYLLLNLLFNVRGEVKEYLFSDIEGAVLAGEVDAGLIIHESRFTYSAKGLKKVVDLGEYMEKKTGLPVPLGIIVIHKRVPYDVSLMVNELIRGSLDHAYASSIYSFYFVRQNAKEMNFSALNKHIKLYVNNFSLSLGEMGERAIIATLRAGEERGIVPKLPEKIFLKQEGR